MMDIISEITLHSKQEINFFYFILSEQTNQDCIIQCHQSHNEIWHIFLVLNVKFCLLRSKPGSGHGPAGFPRRHCPEGRGRGLQRRARPYCHRSQAISGGGPARGQSGRVGRRLPRCGVPARHRSPSHRSPEAAQVCVRDVQWNRDCAFSSLLMHWKKRSNKITFVWKYLCPCVFKCVNIVE